MMLRKIIYFDRETIKNILQEKDKGTRTKTSGTSSEADLSLSIDAESSASAYLGVPMLARLKFVFTGTLNAQYLLRHDSSTTITSTEISDFESIQDGFVKFENQQVYDIENSSTFFRVAGGYLKMMGNNVEEVNVKEFKDVMDSFEGYDVYKINGSTYIRFNNSAFVSNYKRNDLLTTKITVYCVPIGNFPFNDFDFMKQLAKMQKLISTANVQTLADVYPAKLASHESPSYDNTISGIVDNQIKLYDVVYACVAQPTECNR